MTTQEIKNKISSAIRGQGTNVDGGGVLADILEALADGVEAAEGFNIDNLVTLDVGVLELSAEVYRKIIESGPIIKHLGQKYILSTAQDLYVALDGAIPPPHDIEDATVWVNYYGYDADDLFTDSFTAIGVASYSDAQSNHKYGIMKLEL